MIPIDPPPECGVYVVIAKSQEEYNSLPSRIDSANTITTLWSFTEEERKAIAEGKNLFLEIFSFGNPMQPIHLYVEGI